MRLATITLVNFRMYREASVGLADTTVIVGANDSGKTTLAVAIACLFSDEHDVGNDYSWESLRQHSLYDVGDHRNAPTLVQATFGDLTDTEEQLYSVFVRPDGTMRTAKLFDSAHPHGISCIPLAREQLERIASFDREADESESESLARWVNSAVLERQGDYWVPASALSDAMARDDTDWPTPHPAPWVEFPIATPERLLRIPGPEAGAPDVRAWLGRPLVSMATSRLARLIMDPSVRETFASIETDPNMRRGTRLAALALSYMQLLKEIGQALDEATTAITEAYGKAASHYLPGIDGIEIFRPEPSVGLDEFVASALGDWSFEFFTQSRDPGEGAPIWQAPEEMGAGAKRAATLATLELLRDPRIHDPDEWRIVLIEEPEVGLHPAAQRRVASNLKALAGYGIQTLIVTHSSVIVSAFSAESIVVTRTSDSTDQVGEEVTYWRNAELSPATSVRDVGRELGVRPADILLATAFVVVEGPSDAAILSVLAEKNGSRLEDDGVSVIPAGGSGMVSTVTAVLRTTYVDAPVVVILDNGSQTQALALELITRFGERVKVHVLPDTEIEGLFSPASVLRWLVSSGVEIAESEVDRVNAALSVPGRKRALRALAMSHLGREYRVVEDGVAIAGQMTEAEIPAAARHLLTVVSAVPDFTVE